MTDFEYLSIFQQLRNAEVRVNDFFAIELATYGETPDKAALRTLLHRYCEFFFEVARLLDDHENKIRASLQHFGQENPKNVADAKQQYLEKLDAHTQKVAGPNPNINRLKQLADQQIADSFEAFKQRNACLEEDELRSEKNMPTVVTSCREHIGETKSAEARDVLTEYQSLLHHALSLCKAAHFWRGVRARRPALMSLICEPLRDVENARRVANDLLCKFSQRFSIQPPAVIKITHGAQRFQLQLEYGFRSMVDDFWLRVPSAYISSYRNVQLRFQVVSEAMKNELLGRQTNGVLSFDNVERNGQPATVPTPRNTAESDRLKRQTSYSGFARRREGTGPLLVEYAESLQLLEVKCDCDWRRKKLYQGDPERASTETVPCYIVAAISTSFLLDWIQSEVLHHTTAHRDSRCFIAISIPLFATTYNIGTCSDAVASGHWMRRLCNITEEWIAASQRPVAFRVVADAFLALLKKLIVEPYRQTTFKCLRAIMKTKVEDVGRRLIENDETLLTLSAFAPLTTGKQATDADNANRSAFHFLFAYGIVLQHPYLNQFINVGVLGGFPEQAERVQLLSGKDGYFALTCCPRYSGKCYLLIFGQPEIAFAVFGQQQVRLADNRTFTREQFLDYVIEQTANLTPLCHGAVQLTKEEWAALLNDLKKKPKDELKRSRSTSSRRNSERREQLPTLEHVSPDAGHASQSAVPFDIGMVRITAIDKNNTVICGDTMINGVTLHFEGKDVVDPGDIDRGVKRRRYANNVEFGFLFPDWFARLQGEIRNGQPRVLRAEPMKLDVLVAASAPAVATRGNDSMSVDAGAVARQFGAICAPTNRSRTTTKTAQKQHLPQQASKGTPSKPVVQQPRETAFGQPQSRAAKRIFEYCDGDYLWTERAAPNGNNCGADALAIAIQRASDRPAEIQQVVTTEWIVQRLEEQRNDRGRNERGNYNSEELARLAFDEFGLGLVVLQEEFQSGVFVSHEFHVDDAINNYVVLILTHAGAVGDGGHYEPVCLPGTSSKYVDFNRVLNCNMRSVTSVRDRESGDYRVIDIDVDNMHRNALDTERQSTSCEPGGSSLTFICTATAEPAQSRQTFEKAEQSLSPSADPVNSRTSLPSPSVCENLSDDVMRDALRAAIDSPSFGGQHNAAAKEPTVYEDFYRDLVRIADEVDGEPNESLEDMEIWTIGLPTNQCIAPYTAE